MSSLLSCFGQCLGRQKDNCERCPFPPKCEGQNSFTKGNQQLHDLQVIAPDSHFPLQGAERGNDVGASVAESALPSWIHELRRLRSKLIGIHGAPMHRIADGANLVADLTSAGLVSILGATSEDISFTDTCRWVTLHSSGVAAGALPPGLQLSPISSWGHPDLGRPDRPLELPLKTAASFTTSRSRVGHGDTCTVAMPSKQSPMLLGEWRHLLYDLSQICPSPQWRAVLLPLTLDGRLIGALLLLLQLQQHPPLATSRSHGLSSRIRKMDISDGDFAAQNSGSCSCIRVGLDGGGRLDQGLMQVAECLAECCLGPVLPTIEQVCLTAELMTSAVRLQDAAVLLTGSLTALLSEELHLELGVRLALIPARESPLGVLFYAPATDRRASKTGAAPQSPRCPLQGPVTATATATGTAIATATLTTLSTTGATNIVSGAGGQNVSAGVAANLAAQTASFIWDLPFPPPPQALLPLQQQQPGHHIQLQQAGQMVIHRLGMTTGSLERAGLAASAASGPAAPEAGHGMVRGPHQNGKRIVIALPTVSREGTGDCSGPSGLGYVAAAEDDPSGQTLCQSAVDNSLATSWNPLMVVHQGGGSTAGGGVGTSAWVAPGGGASAAEVSCGLPRAVAAQGPCQFQSQMHLSRSHLSSGFPLHRNATSGPGGLARGQGWKASPFATSSTLLTALLNGKVNQGEASPPPPPPPPPTIEQSARSGSDGAFLSSQIHLRSALVPDVPAWLQDATKPSSDMFSIVRRSGVAGGLSSLIALVAEPATEVGAVDIPSGGGGGSAVLPSQLRQRPATGPLCRISNGPARICGLSSGAAGKAAPPLTVLPPQPRTSWLGPHRERNSVVSVEGFDSVLGTAGGAGRGGGGGGDGGGGSGDGGGGSGGGGGSLGTTIVGLYLYSSLPLPLSFLQAARERALGLMQVLAPVLMRALHAGHMADEWNYLYSQVLGGIPGAAAGSIPSAPPSVPYPLMHSSPIGFAAAAAAAGAAAGSGPGAPSRQPDGGGSGGGLPAISAARTQSLMAAMPVNASGYVADSLAAAAATAVAAAADMVCSAACTGTVPHPGPMTGNVAALTVTGTSGGLDVGMTATSETTTSALSPFPERMRPRISLKTHRLRNPPEPLCTAILPAASLEDATACRVISSSGATTSPAPTGAAMAPPAVVARERDRGGEQCYTMFSSSGMDDVTPPGNAADEPLGGSVIGGLGLALAGGTTATGIESEWGVSSMTLLTNTVSDLGPVARQQNMATLVTAFTTTLSRALRDTEQMGGAHAEDDIRNLRILRAIGVGGCSVVVLARLHAMPVAVKVILPLEDEEDGGTAVVKAGKCGNGGADKKDPTSRPAADAGASSFSRPPYQSLMAGPWAVAAIGEGNEAPGEEEGGPGAGKALRAGFRAQRLSTVKRRSRLQALMRGARELAVLTTISHPNIVQVYSYCTRVVVREEEPGMVKLEMPPEGMQAQAPLCTALIMEYCDMGSLADCIDTGNFAKAARAAAATLLRQQQQQQPVPARAPRRSSSGSATSSAASTAGSAAMCAVYLTLVEVALALRHLHSMKLVHCDVKPANVLLRSSATDPRGFTAKLTDFGFVNLAAQGEASVGGWVGAGSDQGKPGAADYEPVGTVTHMAPELLQGCTLDPSLDIYSFGILMWEVYTGRAPYGTYADDNFAAVPQKVIQEGLRPKFPLQTPSHFKTLAMACWSSDASRRPSASELVTRLQALLDASCGAEV
ncbi:hypothetical protein VaNZ11_001013 [Volvox africanus]|uniref:Protein kinase domain-containing protein n=1 Tax=Volvox africanus TaxID=51714 RepID=A0ABQ5RQ06_9CHLO|nr:hypothetical protein VaNZ11_001013 [Volvox africanus]